MTKAPPKTRQERQTNFKVVIRVRPPLNRELHGDVPFQNIVAVDDREQSITVSENLDAVMDEDGNVLANPGPYSTHSFVFDYVYDQHCTQKKVYETTARTVVDSALQGYNATIFAYGQTGTGKTFTMEGFNREGGLEARGIIPRAIEQIFGHIQKFASPKMRFLVRASYLQIYNEQISDLLKPERNNLTIREDKRRGVYVDGLSEWVVRSPAEIYGLMERGGAIRATGETKMNEMSSRSHAVFIVIAEQSETVYVDDQGQDMTTEEFQRFMSSRGARREQDMKNIESHLKQSFKVGKLNLVDLAGSERVRLSGASGQRLKESQHINTSLAELGNVISALVDAKSRQHIPYRNSKLTRMLEDSLGGNCKTTMMAMISPAFEAMQETISTLKFANRAKNIKNEAKVNEDLDQKSLLRKYERELKQLRAELEERSKNVVDKRRLLELDEQRRRAEADKMTAIRALEARSLEFMHEKEEKKKLEQRIAMLMGQMIRGDRSGVEGTPGRGDGEVHPEVHTMMKEQQEKLTKEYEFKLADLERERETIEEEKAQVDRYKQLLLKQRDIMIALTQRLVERDEQIMALQDELDAYDSHHKELEEKLDEKTAMLIKFQRISMEVNATSPYKNEELNKAMESWSHTDFQRAPGATEVENEDFDRASPAVRSTIADQRARIVQLEQKLAESVDSARNSPKSATRGEVETLLQNELDASLRQLPEASTRDAVKNLIQKVIVKVNGLSLSTDSGRGIASNTFSPVRTAADEEALRIYKEQNASLRMEKTKLLRELESLRANPPPASAASSPATAALQTRCDTLVKEREAVTTIMEQKIKVLVQSVAQNVAAVVGQHPQVAGSESSAALNKDLVALQRLVGASIAALKNAAANNGSGGSGGSGGAGNNALAPVTPSNNIGSGAGVPSSMPGRAPRPQGPPPSFQQPEQPRFSANPNVPSGGMNGQGFAGNSALGTPIALPSFPSPGYANGMGSNPNLRASYGSQGSGNSVNSWGEKDESYSAGDVYRSVERR